MRKRFRRTTLLTIVCLSFLAGLGLARIRVTVDTAFVLLSIVALIVTVRKIRGVTLVAGLLCGLTIGLWRGVAYMEKLAPYADLKDRAVIITGIADSDGIYDGSQLSFDLGHLKSTDPFEKDLVGKMSIRGFGEQAVYKGDKLQVEGKLFLTRGSRQSSISFAQLKVLGRSNSLINKTKRNFEAGMQSALPEPQASFGLGILIGQRSTLPDDTKKQLSATGLTHIVAVSGYNLTIIVWAVRQLLRKRSKYQTTLISLGLIGMFLLFTGLSASIVRAAIVSGLSLWAWYYGRRINPVLLIVLAAALTAGWYPIYLWSDIGWYLSFLAFYGVLVLAPLLAKRIYSARKTPKFLSLLIIETLCAQVMALPLIMYIFGEFSLVALIANILIVPLVPLAMLLSLLAGLGGMVLPAFAGWIAWPARLLMTYMLDLISMLSKIPFALTNTQMSLSTLIAFYVIVLFITSILWHKNRGKRDIVSEKNSMFTTGV